MLSPWEQHFVEVEVALFELRAAPDSRLEQALGNLLKAQKAQSEANAMGKSENHAIFGLKNAAGYWQLGGPMGVKFAQQQRPRWLHRTMMRLLLGIEWNDGPVA